MYCHTYYHTNIEETAKRVLARARKPNGSFSNCVNTRRHCSGLVAGWSNMHEDSSVPPTSLRLHNVVSFSGNSMREAVRAVQSTCSAVPPTCVKRRRPTRCLPARKRTQIHLSQILLSCCNSKQILKRESLDWSTGRVYRVISWNNDSAGDHFQGTSLKWILHQHVESGTKSTVFFGAS